MKNITLKTVNKALKIKYPLLELIKDNTYFYVYSEDENVSLQLSGLYSTSIDICKINHCSIDQWIIEVELVLSDWQRNELEKEPVIFN